MSTVYIQEPATKGKLVIHTNQGPIDVELWSKEAPKTTRHFLQLALQGYYKNTLFHRLIPKFILQGGESPNRK
ncbi:cytochrome P450 monooxygenase 57, partial [Coelomomyces lativittatus]